MVVFGSCLFFTECKKYDEDDIWIQWKRPEKRLIKYGPWVFDKLTVDGVDKSDEFRGDSAFIALYRFSEPDPINMSATSMYELIPCDYKLIDNNNKIQIQEIYQNPTYGQYYLLLENNTWIIKRLSKNGFIIETEINGKNYRLELIPRNT